MQRSFWRKLVVVVLGVGLVGILWLVFDGFSADSALVLAATSPTLTYTSTLNPAPPPALPLQILFDAKTSRAGDGVSAELTIEVRDAFGNPVTGAESTLVWGGSRFKLGLSSDGSFGKPSISSTSSNPSEAIGVEVYWNQELIAQQDFVVSWQ